MHNTFCFKHLFLHLSVWFFFLLFVFSVFLPGCRALVPSLFIVLQHKGNFHKSSCKTWHFTIKRCVCVPQYFTSILIVLCQLFRFCQLPLWSHRMLDPFTHNVQINSQMYFDCSDLPWSENILTCQSKNKIWHRKETPRNAILTSINSARFNCARWNFYLFMIPISPQTWADIFFFRVL